MKCPNCGSEGCKYDDQHSKRSRTERLAGKKTEERTNFNVTCRKCGFKGEMKP